MRRGVIAALLAGLLGGCSGDSAPDAKPIAGGPKQVAAAVSELEADIRAKRYEHICDRLFTREARRRAGGRDCAGLLRSNAREVRRPRIELLSIDVERAGASARVRTRAAGQQAIEETIRLHRKGGRYRIESLAG